MKPPLPSENWQLFGHLRWLWVAIVLALVPALHAQAQPTRLTLETWRVDDAAPLSQHILPTFTRSHATIQVVAQPSAPVDYDRVLRDKLAKGTAGDLLACRPFDQSLDLYDKGYLEDITAMPELRRYRSHGKIAWTTYYADRVFCMPVAAVMTGFFYNTHIFKELNLSPPQTEEELFIALEKIQQSGKYLPLAFGTRETWQSAQVLFAGIGPNYWNGEQGRSNLLTGRAKFTDAPYVDTWRTLARLADFLPPNHRQLSEKDTRELFLSGKAAIYPAGSWEIPFLSAHARAKQFGVFAPPPKQVKHNCYVLSHFDIGIGINAHSAHPEQAREFVSWLSTREFAQVLVNSLHGFFPLSTHAVQINNPLAQEMMSWRQQCDSTIRINSQFLNQAWPDMEHTLWDVSARVMRKELTPEQAAEQIANGVEKWFKPI